MGRLPRIRVRRTAADDASAGGRDASSVFWPWLLVPLALAATQEPGLRVEYGDRIAAPELAGAGTVVGRLLDADTEEPIAGAVIGLGESRTALSGEDGRFRFERVPAGTHVLTAEHVAYGRQSAPVLLEAGVEQEVRAYATVRPIPLDSLEVTGVSEAERARRSAITRRDLMTGVELERARARGETMAQLVGRFPGIRVRYGRFTTLDDVATGACVESNRATPRLTRPPPRDRRFPLCEALPIFLDGVYIGDPIGFLRELRLDDFESVELVPEIVAGTRYGLLAGNGGVLVLTTRRR